MSEDSANIARFLPALAASNPHGIAVKAPKGVHGGQIEYISQSFAQLNSGADASARQLEAYGVVKGARVLLMVKPGIDLIQLCFALFKIGAVPVVIDPGMGLKSFLNCVRRSKPAFLVGIPLAIALSHLFRPTFSSLKARICIGRSWRRKVGAAQPAAPYRVAHSDARELAAILFTSGSTGMPKGVCYEHGMFAAQVDLIRASYSIQPGEVDLPMLPIFALFNPALGMTTVVPAMNPSRPAAVDPWNIVQAIKQNSVTNSFGSPVLWTKIGRYCEQQGITLPTLKRVLMAGAPVGPGLMELMSRVAPNAQLHSPYGATECLPVSSVDAATVLGETWAATVTGKGTCVGKPLPGVDVIIIPINDDPILDFSRLKLLPAHAVGEIVVGGAIVTQAYDRLPEENAKAKIRHFDGRLWHRIGDLGYLDEQGRLWFCGRKAERVRTAAGDLYTDCCEAIFNAHPGVFRSALIGLGAPGSQVPALVIEPEPGARLAHDELCDLAQRHPHTAAIQQFYQYAPFPVDVRHNAKIHRLTLAHLVRDKHRIQ
ncbi:MAG: AMP-binding protein [Verrucomicrobia bacterium]|nr:AMP-binding protein [Verrucomicrobiota bacterium]